MMNDSVHSLYNIFNRTRQNHRSWSSTRNISSMNCPRTNLPAFSAYLKEPLKITVSALIYGFSMLSIW